MARHNKNDADKDNQQPSDPSRRNLLKSAGIVSAAAVGSVTGSNVIAADSNQTQQSTSAIVAREALEVLTAEEADTLEAICDCLIPSDENGPGAKEARAVHYIDRALASHNSDARHNYMVGLAGINDFSRQTRGKPFYQLIRDQQESVLLAVQANKVPGLPPSGSGFFNMLRSHTIDGTFSDPYYGGNQNFVGWDMLRYPGIRLGASESDTSKGAELQPNHESAYDNSTYTKMAANMNGKLGGAGGSDHA